MERITSRKNELVAHIRKLSGSRSARRAAGEFVCDGPKLLAEALKWGAAVTTVVAEEGTSRPSGHRITPTPRISNPNASSECSSEGTIWDTRP